MNVTNGGIACQASLGLAYLIGKRRKISTPVVQELILVKKYAFTENTMQDTNGIFLDKYH